jgi:hypothetical protein
MRKLAVISFAALTLSLAAASGAQAVDRLPIVPISPPGATSGHYPGSVTSWYLRCLSCDRRPPVGRYPPGYTPPAQKSDAPDAQPQDQKADPPPPRVPPGYQPPEQKKDAPANT